MTFPNHSQEHSINKLKSIPKKMSKTSISPKKRTRNTELGKEILLAHKEVEYIISSYERFANNKMSEDDKWLFSNHIYNLYHKNVEHTQLGQPYGLGDLVPRKKEIESCIKDLKSNNSKDRNIAIDNFMGYAHGRHLLHDLIIDPLTMKYSPYGPDSSNYNQEDIDKASHQVSLLILNRLNAIRNKKGLGNVKYIGADWKFGATT